MAQPSVDEASLGTAGEDTIYRRSFTTIPYTQSHAASKKGPEPNRLIRIPRAYPGLPKRLLNLALLPSDSSTRWHLFITFALMCH